MVWCRAFASELCKHYKKYFINKKTVNIIHFASFRQHTHPYSCSCMHSATSHVKNSIRCTVLPHFVSISMECNNIVHFPTVCGFFACFSSTPYATSFFCIWSNFFQFSVSLLLFRHLKSRVFFFVRYLLLI